MQVRQLYPSQFTREGDSDGAFGVEVERLRPDIVIIDARMPRLDGITATRQINRRWPRIGVVVRSLAEELRALAPTES